MKILYFHQYFSTHSGKCGTRSYSFAKFLVKAGHNVQVVCLRDQRSESGLSNPFVNGFRTGYVDGIEILEFDIPYSNHQSIIKRSFVFALYSWKSLLIALKNDPDLIFATSTPLTAAIPGVLSRWIKGTPFVFEVRDLWPELPKAMGVVTNPVVILALEILEISAYLSADKCIGLAPGICDGISERGINLLKLKIIPNGCDLDLFKPSKKSKPEKIKLLNKYIDYDLREDGDYLIAAYTGAHGIANGLNAILDVAYELQQRGRNDIKFLLIGDGSCKAELQKRKLVENIRNCYFIDPISKYELSNLISNSVDIGLMVLSNVKAFYRGTSPNKFFDYISSGLAVVNNYPGWLADLITRNNLGLVVPPEDFRSFADTIIYLADNPEEINKMKINARSFAEKNFSRDDLSIKFLETIEETADRFSRRQKNYFFKQLYSIFKGIADRVFATLFIIILSPIFIFAILLRLFKDIEVFSKQKYLSYLGKSFLLFKFNPITDNIDYESKFIPNTYRVKLFSRFINYLPLIINVLKGDISLIGPRALLMENTNQYLREKIKRFEAKPGLIGWAQVMGIDSISLEKELLYDIWYIDNRSFFLDLKIIFMNLIKLFKGSIILLKSLFKNKPSLGDIKK